MWEPKNATEGDNSINSDLFRMFVGIFILTASLSIELKPDFCHNIRNKSFQKLRTNRWRHTRENKEYDDGNMREDKGGSGARQRQAREF
jgi:hypothetical protein